MWCLECDRLIDRTNKSSFQSFDDLTMALSVDFSAIALDVVGRPSWSLLHNAIADRLTDSRGSRDVRKQSHWERIWNNWKEAIGAFFEVFQSISTRGWANTPSGLGQSSSWSSVISKLCRRALTSSILLVLSKLPWIGHHSILHFVDNLPNAISIRMCNWDKQKLKMSLPSSFRLWPLQGISNRFPRVQAVSPRMQ